MDSDSQTDTQRPPLSEHERQQAFVAALHAAELDYGYTVRSSIQVAGLGVVLSVAEDGAIQPGPTVIVPIAGWRPSEATPA